MEALCERFWTRATRYAERQMGARVRRFVEPEAIAEQALEEVLGALDRLPGGADEDEVIRRLQRAVRSHVLMAVRKHRNHVGESQAPAPRADTQPSMGVVTRADERAWVQRLVAQLPDDHREVVRLCALEELTFVEAGRRLDLAPDTVRKRYHRASELLRDALERRMR